MQRWTTALSAALIGLFAFQGAMAEVKGSPDILVLGDSQLSFGAGVAFVELFGAMRGDCGLAPKATVGVIGVRSSTLQSWTSTGRSAKSAICDVDPKWKVNAGVYGTLSKGENPYVQIGLGEQFQFFSHERSPLEAVFQDGYYRPDLVLMFLMANFRRKGSGKVKDPYHPTEAAARKFMALQRGALCRAVAQQLGR